MRYQTISQVAQVTVVRRDVRAEMAELVNLAGIQCSQALERLLGWFANPTRSLNWATAGGLGNAQNAVMAEYYPLPTAASMPSWYGWLMLPPLAKSLATVIRKPKSTVHHGGDSSGRTCCTHATFTRIG